MRYLTQPRQTWPLVLLGATLALACGGGGGSSPSLVAVVAPSALTYASNPAVYPVGTAIAANVPSHGGGTVLSYGASPTLPTGLSLDASTGVISGTPTARSPKATYTISASNSGGSTSTALSITVIPIPRFAFVVNPDDNTVFYYTVNAATGQLRTNGYNWASGSGPQSVAVDPSGKFAYVANSGSGTVTPYIITAHGIPSAFTPVATGTTPYSVTVDPSGKFAYVANFGSNNVSAYTIDPFSGHLTSAGTVGSGAQPLSVVVDPSARFAYVGCNDGQVSAYTINSSTGALTAVGGGPFSTPNASNARSVTVDPLGRFVYVANASGSVSAYSINPTTGGLASVAGSPFTAGTFPISVTVEPSGRFVYAANLNSNNVSAFTIDATTGALSSLGTFATGTGPQSVLVDPSGAFLHVANAGSKDVSTFAINASTGALSPRFTVAGRGGASISMASGAAAAVFMPKTVYVANSNGGNTYGSVSAFGINSATGALSALSGSPFASGWNTQDLTLGRSPYDLGSGPFLYIANYNPTLTGFLVAADGGLSALSGSPYAAPTSHNAWAAAVDPSGHFAYFANYNNGGAGSVSAFTVDPLDGHLVAITGSPFPAGNGPSAIALDPAGQFAYVANAFGNSVSAFTISATTGDLTRLDADPSASGVQDYAAGSSPSSVAVDPSGRFVYVANSGDGTVSVYAIVRTTGALMRLDADPGTAGIQDFSLGRVLRVAIDPSGRYAYFIKDGGFNQVLTYAINATTGGISFIGSIATGANPRSLTIDGSGTFAYVANYVDNSLSVYRIDSATGLLTALSGSPFAISGATAPIAVTTLSTIQ